SIAILLQERKEQLKQSYTIQLFATDIDDRAIAVARSGVYPESIAADITPERLARFFTLEPDGSTYRIHKNIRDLLIFSEQDLIKDPPFSKLDLISCRNLLIYLGPELQKRLIPLFHYALNPGGRLFLGSSEGVGEFSELFAVLDRKAKLYLRRDESIAGQRRALGKFLEARTEVEALPLKVASKKETLKKPALREVTEELLLQEIAPAGALVNSRGDILYLHGRSGMFLEPAQGEAGVNNILKMARDGLLPALAAALHKAVSSHEVVRRQGLNVKTNGHFTLVNLTIRPVTDRLEEVPEVPLYLVILEEMPEPDPELVPLPASAGGTPTDAVAQIAALQQELRAKEEYLQSTHEELESSSEELKSSNEEMQSVNEELQSTNEELETSKEELQSINEELATVNAELQLKVVDLSRANNDMNNLLAGTGIGTVFVDHQLRILRFTPDAAAITNLILSDVGRPLVHIVSNLVGYEQLLADVKSVLQTLASVEREVQTGDGKWFTMRILPYRTLDNVIEGAVISFFDISEMVQTREALHAANEQHRLAVVVHDASDAITVKDLEGRILAWNPGAVRLYG
ncbi:MAG: CheR family methyltransferase, partial [Verrucomicrobiales bacterium]